MTKQEEIANFINTSVIVRDALNRYDFAASGLPDPNVYGSQPSVENFAANLLEVSEFRALQLGNWLGTTDGQIITQAVEMVLPPVYHPQFDFLVAALQYAAQLQQSEGRKTAGAVALGILIIGVLAFAISGD